MKKEILLTLGVLLPMAIIPTANAAHVGVNIGIGVPAYGAYPAPVPVYQPAPYYAPPPAVYFGAGSWGDDRRRWHGNGRWHGDHRR